MAVCDEKSETCLVSYTAITSPGNIEEKTEKGCGSTYRCTFPPIYFNMGPKVYRSHWVCCMGETCKSVTVHLPPLMRTNNGYQCPGCYARSESCTPETVNCTGWDKSCFEIASHAESSNGSHIDRTMMGCTNRFVCATMETERGIHWYGSGSVQKAQCKPISDHGSRSTSLCLTLISALLMMKFFLDKALA
ncbi:uncharacterized protein LOC121915272 isoform X2 [Sceloporus undulatus]|nr:uncharacterized protein LOC121915272 isoform X2 [Sceloporus undulatus]